MNDDFENWSRERVDHMLKYPGLWAQEKEALEAQVVTLLEVQVLASKPHQLKNTPDLVHGAYRRWAIRQKNLGTLPSQEKSVSYNDLTKLLVEFNTYFTTTLLPNLDP